MATFPLGRLFQQIIKLTKLCASYFSLHLCTFLHSIQRRHKQALLLQTCVQPALEWKWSFTRGRIYDEVSIIYYCRDIKPNLEPSHTRWETARLKSACTSPFTEGFYSDSDLGPLKKLTVRNLWANRKSSLFSLQHETKSGNKGPLSLWAVWPVVMSYWHWLKLAVNKDPLWHQLQWTATFLKTNLAPDTKESSLSVCSITTSLQGFGPNLKWEWGFIPKMLSKGMSSKGKQRLSGMCLQSFGFT